MEEQKKLQFEYNKEKINELIKYQTETFHNYSDKVLNLMPLIIAKIKLKSSFTKGRHCMIPVISEVQKYVSSE